MQVQGEKCRYGCNLGCQGERLWDYASPTSFIEMQVRGERKGLRVRRDGQVMRPSAK